MDGRCASRLGYHVSMLDVTLLTTNGMLGKMRKR